MLRNKLFNSVIITAVLLVGFSVAGFSFPSISNDFVFVIDKSDMMQNDFDWVMDAHADMVRDELTALASGPGQIFVGIITFANDARVMLELTDVYTDLDAILEALSPRTIDRITDGFANTSEGIDAARAMLDGGVGFRKMIFLSSRYFPNHWDNVQRPIFCMEGAEGICSRVAMRNACSDALAAGYEIWALEIDKFGHDFDPRNGDFPLMMSECAGRSERAGEAGSRSSFMNFAEKMIEPGLNACINVGFEFDLDRNLNDRVDTIEFFNAMDFWISDCVPDSTFFILVDLWVNGTRISQSDISGASTPEPQVSMNSSQLRVSAQGASSIKLDVYNLNGSNVHSQSAMGSRLSWNLRANRTLANGVYFAQITTLGANGQALSHELKKIAVLR